MINRRGVVAGGLGLAVGGIMPKLAKAQDWSGKRVLVIYDTRTGHTRTVADLIHRRTGGDRVEIEPVTPYPEDYDALLLPGGVMNPDKLRRDERVLEFVREFFEEGKPVAAICHAPWTLIDAGVVEGRHVTSYPSIRTDLENAGAEWTDEEVVVDQGLVTSRKPEDLPAFNAKMLEEIAEGRHAAARGDVEAGRT